MADVVESAKTGHSSSVAFGGILVGLAWNGSRIIPGFHAASAETYMAKMGFGAI
jgi:hypothetical protein